jgi:hypothetical protein
MPKKGSLERIVLEKLMDNKKGGVSYYDFVGIGIKEQNIEKIIDNLRYGMYESDNDDEVKFDS